MMSSHHALQGQKEGVTGPTPDHFSVHLWIRSTATLEEGKQMTNKM